MPRFVDRTNNNLVERLNGTVRERDKVMRGFKNEESAQQILEAFRAYYNFIRKHQSLKGARERSERNDFLRERLKFNPNPNEIKF